MGRTHGPGALAGRAYACGPGLYEVEPAIPDVLRLLARPVVFGSVLCWVLLAVALWRPLVARWALPRWPTLLALLSGATIGVVTLTPDGWYRVHSPGYCLRLGSGDLRFAAAHFLAGAPEMFNVLLFVPLGLFLVLTLRRVAVPAVAVTALPVAVELFQALFGQRVCTVLDVLDNAAGGLVGVAAGGLVLTVERRTANERNPGA